MHLHADTPRIEDSGLVGSYHCIHSLAQGTVHDPTHLLHLVIVKYRIDCQIGLDTVLPGCRHDAREVVEGKIGRRPGTHVQLSHAEIDGIGTGRHGRHERFVGTDRGHYLYVAAFFLSAIIS